MSHDSDKDGTNDQRKSRGSTKVEFMQMTSQPTLDRVRQEPCQREFYKCVEEPKHQQRERKSENKGAEQAVPEPVVDIEAEKVLEVRGEGANQQSRKYEAEASKRQSCGTVC
jgi:hypothetical protein